MFGLMVVINANSIIASGWVSISCNIWEVSSSIDVIGVVNF